MDSNSIDVIKFALVIIIFLGLMAIVNFISKRIDIKSYKLFNPHEYFPEEEVHSLRQIFYLIMMGLFFINIIYTLISRGNNNFYLAIFDILLSLYLAIRLDKSSLKNKILLILLIPFGSLTFIIFGTDIIEHFDILHILLFAYYIKVYFDKFMEYTKSNGLGIAIILLFTIIFLSFLLTQIAENVNPLDSIDMVSNAFTSNGYTVLGSTVLGKLNSIVLVWSGYILSGVGTATLTAGILIRYYSGKMDEYDEKLKESDKKFDEMNAKLDEIKDLINREEN